MLVVGLIIMVMKALFLSNVEKGNRGFLKLFHEAAGDEAALDNSAGAGSNATAFANSTLYRTFHVGAQEIAKRIHASTNGRADAAAELSPQSIEAVRASMDATLVREGQRLSAQMVLLTIAIAGGPFLGLLGTVIGVMITFAAIAASGDVNVNAIAPGVSAALAATVAGLAVAIPCLFGYNWLNSRIKAINADTRVFVDEFVARIAEKYSN
jgi:biopolymer transport protein ExbB